MKPSELKTLIKEACREAFKEEMKDILLEAIKSPKTIVQESEQIVERKPKRNLELREKYSSLIEGMGRNEDHQEETPQQTLGPIPGNTISEGSALPSGEVPLNLIKALTNRR